MRPTVLRVRAPRAVRPGRLQRRGFGLSSSSSSSSAQVVIEPAGTYVVDADATTAQIGDVQVGEQAVITPVGGTATFYGIVSSFSIYGSTSSGVTSFPVTVLVTGNSSGLYPGASADVELVIRQVNNVLVVPTSAVHTMGRRHTWTC